MQSKGADVQLSPRECQVAALLLQDGLTIRAVAEQLGISPYTVRGHVNAMFRGLHLHSIPEVIRWIDQHPRALRGDWCDWRTHPYGCECNTLPFCVTVQAELAMVAASGSAEALHN